MSAGIGDSVGDLQFVEGNRPHVFSECAVINDFPRFSVENQIINLAIWGESPLENLINMVVQFNCPNLVVLGVFAFASEAGRSPIVTTGK